MSQIVFQQLINPSILSELMKFWGHGVLSDHKPIISETQHWSVPRAITVYYRFPNKRGNKDWCGGLMITMLCIKRAHTPNWARFLPAFVPVDVGRS